MMPKRSRNAAELCEYTAGDFTRRSQNSARPCRQRNLICGKSWRSSTMSMMRKRTSLYKKQGRPAYANSVCRTPFLDTSKSPLLPLRKAISSGEFVSGEAQASSDKLRSSYSVMSKQRNGIDFTSKVR